MTNAKQRVLNWGDDTNYVKYHVPFAYKFGVNESIILSKLITQYNYWSGKGKIRADDSFYFTVDDMHFHTGMTKSKQATAINRMKKDGLLFSDQDGLPGVRYFILYFDAIEAKMAEACEEFEKVKQEREKKRKEREEKKLMVRAEKAVKARFNQVDENERPDNSKVAENERPDNSKVAENDLPSWQEIGDLAGRKSATSIKDLSIKDLSTKDFDRQTEALRIYSMLVDNKHSQDEAQEFAFKFAANENIALGSYTDEDILNCIYESYKEYLNPLPDKRQIFQPYSWAVGKLERLIAKKQKFAAMPKPKGQPAGKKAVRSEQLPAWFTEKEKEQPQEQTEDFLEKKAKLEAELKARKE